MSVLDIPSIANLWVDNGGARSRLVAAVSIALAQSGGDTSMSTEDGHIGLWGITQQVARKLKVSADQLTDPNASTALAIQLSGNGTNWGLWSVVWAPDATPSRRQQVLWPQPGSAAFQEMGVVQVHIGAWDGVDYADTFGDPLGDLGYAWNTLTWTLTAWSAQAWNSINDTAWLAEGLQQS
jgi:hypothetical protein